MEVSIVVDYPPTLGGKAEDQLRQVYTYLSQMADALNNGLNQLDVSQFVPEQRVALMTVTDGEAQQEQKSEREALKAMIIKNAGIVRQTMDLIATELKGESVYSGSMGELVQNFSNAVTLSAKGIVQSFRFDEQIATLQGGLQDYKGEMESVIRIGMQDGYTDDTGLPLVGVGIYDKYTDTGLTKMCVILSSGALRFL